MKRNKLYISTVADDACQTARRYGLGLEIAEYCTAWNMDDHFAETDAAVRAEMQNTSRFVFHAPFNELSPAAIDPLVLDVTRRRYTQAITLARSYSIRKIVIHSGFTPQIYYKPWFEDRAIAFWRDFIQTMPEDTRIVMENVLEDEPELLLKVIRAVDDPRLRLCLDIGHVNAYSPVSAEEWIKTCGDLIGHFHIHNNSGAADTHSGLTEGSIPMEELLHLARQAAPEATYTIESLHAEASVSWLEAQGILED